MNNDPVNHPSHYTRGKIEVADFIEDQGLDKKAWLAMAIKYICRAGYKDPDKYCEDLGKAVWYLNREIERYTREEIDSGNIETLINAELIRNISTVEDFLYNIGVKK